ncbi:radical SAM protein [Synechococcus sp. CCY 9618]|uniref:radical SAM protein n=1 Tax=Synechococcus sp. CCY 9618 TaxID=2815602 RepID=UPI001C23D5AF|nr:radical SAM protein [Synechococcus sp. CCY 9618]
MVTSLSADPSYDAETHDIWEQIKMALPTVLKRAVPSTVQTAVRNFLWPDYSPEPPGQKVIEFWVDVVSGCNLRCTACPVGMPEYTNSIGQKLTEMPIELFEKICLKAKEDTNGNCRFGLYNWTEPTLHSRLHELIACAESHGVPCGISSNLNYDYDWSLLKPLRLWNFTITVSGFTQRTYQINHKGGRIEPVLANMIRISETLGDWECFKNIDVRYLVHKQNQHEVGLFKHFCEKLGMKFTPYHAYYMPIDKMFDGLEAIPPELEYIYYSPQLVQQAIGEHRSQNCFMRESQVCLDHEGNFSVCCVQSPTAPSIANYLDTPFQAMQAKRYGSDLCKQCTNSGINIFATYGMQEPQEIQQKIEDLLPVDLKSFD